MNELNKEELSICDICGEKDIDDDHDFYDCVENDEEKRGIPRGTWMIEWMKRLREEEKKPKPKVKGFKEWSEKH